MDSNRTPPESSPPLRWSSAPCLHQLVKRHLVCTSDVAPNHAQDLGHARLNCVSEHVPAQQRSRYWLAVPAQVEWHRQAVLGSLLGWHVFRDPHVSAVNMVLSARNTLRSVHALPPGLRRQGSPGRGGRGRGAGGRGPHARRDLGAGGGPTVSLRGHRATGRKVIFHARIPARSTAMHIQQPRPALRATERSAVAS